MKFAVSGDWEGKTVLLFLKQYLSLSRGIIVSLKKKEDGILLNGSHVTVRALLHEGDVLSVATEDSAGDTESHVEPVPGALTVVYEDDDLIALHKPGQTPTHPSLNHARDTLANALAYYYRDRPFVFRAVGRLDRDTSGLVLVAKNRPAAFSLSSRIAAGEVEKEYLAVVTGCLREDEGWIDKPIGRKCESLIERMILPVSKGGQDALTRYRVLSRSETMSVAAVFPITGRTHQIRVHFASIGHPLVGDTLYGPPEGDPRIGRQALHCRFLRFRHPSTDQTVTLEAAIPPDILNLMKECHEEK